VVSVLTDYGLADEFVGVLHSVLARLAPGCPVVDLTHGVRRQDVRAGSLALLRVATYLADGVVLAVVDPGVGTARRGVALARPAGATAVPGGSRPGGHGFSPQVAFVAPDNGLVVPALRALGGPWEAVALDGRGYGLGGGGPTFDGRDVFAPAAAHLARGGELGDLGPPVALGSLVQLPAPVTVWRGRAELTSEVTWVDNFGNVQLAAPPVPGGGADIFGTGRATLRRPGPSRPCGPSRPSGPGGAAWAVTVVRAFAELGPGRLGLLVDSCGQLALCLDGASAAELTGLKEGDLVTLLP
jgi:hypothetical protein